MIPEGLQYIPNFITGEAAITLIDMIDRLPWLNILNRRVQHHGWRYDYRARQVTPDMYIGELPTLFQALATRLFTEQIFQATPDQVITNEYNPGQGIGTHVDCVPCFGPIVASLSLGSGTEMEFAYGRGSGDCPVLHHQYLEPNSLIVLSSEARYSWTHEIKKRHYDVVGDGQIRRSRRVSVTFRTVI